MPLYIYKNPETDEHKEIVQGMNEEHTYSENGKKWLRVFTKPNASIDTKIDPNDKNGFMDKTSKMRGTIGDIMDYSKELSEQREAEHGEDPVKRQMFNDYKEKVGKKHMRDAPTKIETDKVEVDLSNPTKIEFDD